MRVNSRALPALLALSVLGLAACSKGGDQGAVSTHGLPIIKAGLWEQTETSNGAAPSTSRVCMGSEPALPGAFIVDGCTPGTHAASGAPAPAGDQGTSTTLAMHYVTSLPGAIKPTPSGGFAIDIACSRGDTSTSLHPTISGDLNADFVVDSRSSMGSTGAAPEVDTTHAEYKYVGPCPAS